MIYRDNKEIEASYFGKKVISQICKGLKTVWEAVRSCFGAGYWNSQSPWSNNEGWKN